MLTMTIANKFLGSLLGTYIGHHYHHCLGGQQMATGPVDESLLYQAWLPSIRQSTPPRVATVSTLAAALPWLLYHHDDRQTRHRQLASELATDSLGAIASRLYILGDCLEWLMQSSLEPQASPALLRKHLRQQISTYPTSILPQVNQLFELLEFPSTTSNGAQNGAQLEYHHASIHASIHAPMLTIATAIQQCLTHPENLALALTSPHTAPPVAPIIGCLLGAWGGTSRIPLRWMMSLPNESRQLLTHVSEQLYRNWAGITGVAKSFEAFPLDL